MPMPSSWVDKIFQKLTLTYGRDFLGRWEGVPLEEVKADWAHELDGFQERPEAIKHALQNLPAAKPPTVYEFRNLAANAPRAADKLLPGPKQDMALVNIVMNQLRQPHETQPMKAWAFLLKSRHDAGDKLSANQIRCYRAALGLNKEVTA